MITLDLALVGFGHVGRRFVRLLDERAEQLRREHSVECRVIGICTRRHGTARNLAGLDARAAASLVEEGGSLSAIDAPDSMPGRLAAVPPDGPTFIRDLATAAHARQHGRMVVVETTVLDITAGQPAIAHVKTALESDAHVVTANKGPAAFAYQELDLLARGAGRGFYFEGAVMDGIPIFNLVRETLPAVKLTGFRGVVNSTTNYIISAMEDGREFDEALAEMQAAGIAEADPSLDVDGWDAAAKTAALANVLLGARLTPQDVDRTGLADWSGARIREVAAAGRRVKLVARARREGATVSAVVGAEELDAADLLATLREQQNALVLETDVLGDVAIVQLGGGLTQTAYALLSDLVALRRTLPFA